MAFATEITTAQNSGFAARLNAMVASVRSAMARRKLYRRTLGELGALSNRELADLGLARGEIRRIAYQAAYEA
ncbi:MAG: DUF1127 domain-containing protein [Pelagimonas sp.]|jgi:uncharacterized protein YjiS (DUF1127 family)|nr:DUF1127 domain-containing protein [Pelagimonas sp.]